MERFNYYQNYQNVTDTMWANAIEKMGPIDSIDTVATDLQFIKNTVPVKWSKAKCNTMRCSCIDKFRES